MGSRSDVRYVDADVPPAADYTADVEPLYWSGGPRGRRYRPPLSGHVHLRISDRCLHRDGGPLCRGGR